VGRTNGMLMNKSRQFRPVTVGVLVALVWMSGKASAAQCGSTAAGFEAWKRQFTGEAQARGVSASAIAALMGTTYSTATIAADRGQRSFSLSLDQFLAKRGGSAIVARGRTLKQSNAALFASIQQRFGVPPGPLLAIWGMETGFGRSRGNQNVLSAVATLAYDDRWRPATGVTAEDEREITGSRVLTPAGAKSAVMLWGEGTRFGAKKNGYHGGISPQEVVVPLSVFSPSIPVEGWKDAAPAAPGWWEDLTTAPEIAPAMTRVSPPLPKAKEDELPLFATPPRGKPPIEDWILRLFSSSSYVAQRELASRGAPRDEDVRKVVEALAARGGKMTRVALAQKLEMPLMRLPGFLGAVKRVLNIDQSQVLNLDELIDVVELNIELLRKQFRLDQSNESQSTPSR
jgi:hypothetical protein